MQRKKNTVYCGTRHPRGLGFDMTTRVPGMFSKAAKLLIPIRVQASEPIEGLEGRVLCIPPFFVSGKKLHRQVSRVLCVVNLNR